MAKKGVVLGIDIGGTNTKLGFIDRSGQCMAETSIPTNPHEAATMLIARIQATTEEMFAPLSKTCELKGIGIGAPDANYYKGTVEHPPNLSWEGVVNVVELVNKYYDVPAAITNDANAAAIGEMKFGVAVGMKNFIEITLGTGLGSGIVVNGDLLYGSDGFAGELGHTTVCENGRQCGCGRRGCLEAYASATGICRTAFQLMAESRENSELRDISFNNLTSKIITEAALRGDIIALEAFEYTGRILGIKLADAIAHLSPEAIVLFGGLAGAGELLFKPVRYHMEANMFHLFHGKVKLLQSSLTERNAAVLGAGALIWNELDKKQ